MENNTMFFKVDNKESRMGITFLAWEYMSDTLIDMYPPQYSSSEYSDLSLSSIFNPKCSKLEWMRPEQINLMESISKIVFLKASQMSPTYFLMALPCPSLSLKLYTHQKMIESQKKREYSANPSLLMDPLGTLERTPISDDRWEYWLRTSLIMDHWIMTLESIEMYTKIPFRIAF
jgi:hypothetical protein